MNRYVRNKWVKALRSGMYEQARGCLIARDGGYCCLGVLGMEMVPELCTEPRPQTGSLIGCDGLIGGSRSCGDAAIPDDLAVLWGLDGDAQDTLAEKNDCGMPFPVIADWIEGNL